MKKNSIILVINLILLLNFLSCTDAFNDSDSSSANDDVLTIKLNPSQEFQTIRNFGASDAWSTQFVGKNYPLEKKNRIADLLFSDAFDNEGNPIGIGLGLWRFNIGAGSIAQGAQSNIEDEWRRAESFLTPSGYNWTAHEGQRWFAQAAKDRGVNQFVGFSNSPPVVMTSNGKANSSGGDAANLSASNHDDFAEFLATVVENYKNLYGVEFNYISPFNEPQYDWLNGQEGTPWLNSEIASVTNLLSQKLLQKNLNTKIQIAEAAKLFYLYETADKPGRANQLQDFLNPTSQNYIGGLTNLDAVISGHSYFTTFNSTTLLGNRSSLLSNLKTINPNLEFWMTEYSILEDNIEIKGNGRDLGINPALYMSRVIHADLTVANASSWQWWLAVSPYDYKDGLVYVDNNKNDGQVYDSKLLWGLGNYSKFIKEGYKRIGVSRSDNRSIEQTINGILVSAYKSNTDDMQVVVITNQFQSTVPIKLAVTGKNTFTGKIYQTSALAADNLTLKGNITQNETLNIPPRSIVTIVIE